MIKTTLVNCNQNEHLYAISGPYVKLTRRNKFTKTEFEANLHKLTSNEKKMPTKSEFKSPFLKSLTSLQKQYTISHLTKKIQTSPKKWRKILKTLFLIKAIYESSKPLILRGSNDIKNQISRFKKIFRTNIFKRNIQIWRKHNLP